MNDNDLLTTTGMKLVIHGGNARELIRQSIQGAIEKKFADAKDKLEKANQELLEGHRAQTKVIQLECGGEKQGYNLLFCHGMDTLMTVKSEYQIAEMLIMMLESEYEK